jgi:hypothetical protein
LLPVNDAVKLSAGELTAKGHVAAQRLAEDGADVESARPK